jgi:glycosyltransferase involved in cell wall biosynthesis
MRAAIVTDTYLPQVNGVTTVTRLQVEALAATEHEVTLVAPLYPGQATERLEGQLRVRSMAFPPYPDIRLSLPPYGKVREHLNRFSPDLVHVTTEGPLGLVGRGFALRHDVPLVTSFHTDFPRYTHDYGMGWLEPLVWRWLLWFHGPARRTQTPGEAVVRRLRDHGIRHATLWGRGVDTRRFHPRHRAAELRREWGAEADRPAIVHVGRLAREKNLGMLIESWILARQEIGPQGAAFVLVGDGPVAAELEGRAPWVLRIGFIDRDELARVYASADICVLPSQTETLGLVALEAMASGTAVIAADAGGFRETMHSGENGLLADASDPRAFAHAIVRLCRDAELRRRLADAGRRTAEARDIAKESAELIRQYESVIGGR